MEAALAVAAVAMEAEMGRSSALEDGRLGGVGGSSRGALKTQMRLGCDSLKAGGNEHAALSLRDRLSAPTSPRTNCERRGCTIAAARAQSQAMGVVVKPE
jgi:hypothetical protein